MTQWIQPRHQARSSSARSVPVSQILHVTGLGSFQLHRLPPPHRSVPIEDFLHFYRFYLLFAKVSLTLTNP